MSNELNAELERGTYIRLHNEGGYFRIRGYGFLILFAHRKPLYGLRRNGHHIGRLWWRVLRPYPKVVARRSAHIDGSESQ